MKISARISHLVSKTLLATCLLAFSAGASAQGDDEVPEDAIVVIAPRPITAEIRERGPNGRETAIISLKMVVQYVDLDLKQAGNVDLLMARIRSVARDACKYLDRLYPLNPDPDCQDRAFQNAMPQARAAIAAAQG